METGRLDRQYLSTIDFMDQREIMNKVLDVYDEMGDIVAIMEMADRYEVTAQEEYHYHVNTRLYAAATVAAETAAPSAGASTTVGLTAGSVKPRVNDVMLTAGRYRSLVTAVSGNNITVRPIDTTLIAHEAFDANDKVTFYTNAYAEGTGVSDGYKWPTKQYSNNIQIIKGKTSVTDLQTMTKVEVEFDGKPYYFIKNQHDTFNRFKKDIAHAFLEGQRSNGLVDPNAGNRKVWMTNGLGPSVRASGINLPLRTDSIANFEADFKVIDRAIGRARGPKEYWLWNGVTVNNMFDDWLAEKTPNGAVTYGSFNGGDAKNRAIAFGFGSFQIYGRTWHKVELPILDDPEVFAADGFDGPSRMYAIPGDKVKTQYDAERKDRFRIRYLEAPAGYGTDVTDSRKYHEVLTGGLAPRPTNDIMELGISYNTWQGAEFLGLEHFATTT